MPPLSHLACVSYYYTGKRTAIEGSVGSSLRACALLRPFTEHINWKVANEAAKRQAKGHVNLKRGKEAASPAGTESVHTGETGRASSLTAEKVGIGRDTGEHYLWLYEHMPLLAKQVLE
jgi:hypothetical protein